MRKIVVFFAIFLLAAAFSAAQTSASYSIEESTLNNGGNPQNGTVLTSASYQITLDAIGDSVTGATLTGASFIVDPSPIGSNRPPGEVFNLMISTLASVTTLTWDPETTIGSYTLYRGEIPNLSTGYGSSLQANLADETFEDTEDYAGQPYFYLVTANNRIAEEGTLGFASGGTERE